MDMPSFQYWSNHRYFQGINVILRKHCYFQGIMDIFKESVLLSIISVIFKETLLFSRNYHYFQGIIVIFKESLLSARNCSIKIPKLSSLHQRVWCVFMEEQAACIYFLVTFRNLKRSQCYSDIEKFLQHTYRSGKTTQEVLDW
jgi:hypothetical protein